MTQTVLIAYDGSDFSDVCLDYAKKFLQRDTAIVLFGAFDRVHSVPAMISEDVPECTFQAPDDEWSREEMARRKRLTTYRLEKAKDVLANAGVSFHFGRNSRFIG